MGGQPRHDPRRHLAHAVSRAPRPQCSTAVQGSATWLTRERRLADFRHHGHAARSQPHRRCRRPPRTSTACKATTASGARPIVTRTAPPPGPASFDVVFVADTGLIGRTDGLGLRHAAGHRRGQPAQPAARAPGRRLRLLRHRQALRLLRQHDRRLVQPDAAPRIPRRRCCRPTATTRSSWTATSSPGSTASPRPPATTTGATTRSTSAASTSSASTPRPTHAG